MMSVAEFTLPLIVTTPDAWAEDALEDLDSLLNDHAHLEKKAGQNALELLHRWPEPSPPENWTAAMTAVAKDEVEHLGIVLRLISRRGGRLTKSHRNDYASALRRLVRPGGEAETIDRLMVSALIEARSCERFEILSRCCPDPQLARVYGGLWASEKGHYLSFIDLARQVADRTDVEEDVEIRWKDMLASESRIIQEQRPGSRMHSWYS